MVAVEPGQRQNLAPSGLAPPASPTFANAQNTHRTQNLPSTTPSTMSQPSPGPILSSAYAGQPSPAYSIAAATVGAPATVTGYRPAIQAVTASSDAPSNIGTPSPTPTIAPASPATTDAVANTPPSQTHTAEASPDPSNPVVAYPQQDTPKVSAVPVPPSAEPTISQHDTRAYPTQVDALTIATPAVRSAPHPGLPPPAPPAGLGGIIFEPADAFHSAPPPGTAPELTMPDLCGSEPVIFVNSSAGVSLTLRSVVTSMAASSQRLGTVRCVADDAQLVFTHRIESSITLNDAPDLLTRVRPDPNAIAHLDLAARTAMSMDDFSLTALAAVIGSALSNYVTTGTFFAPTPHAPAQVVYMATNAQAFSAGLVLAPVFAQHPTLVATLARIGPQAGVTRIAVLGAAAPPENAVISEDPMLASLLLRLVRALIDTSAPHALAGRVELAFLRGLCDHIALNGHNREGGFLRTLLRSASYPPSSGYIGDLPVRMYGNERIVADSRLSVETVTRLVINLILRLTYLAECAAPVSDVADINPSTDRYLARAASLTGPGGRPLLPFTAYRVAANDPVPLTAYGGLLPAVQHWISRLQALISGRVSGPDVVTAPNTLNYTAINADCRHLVDPIICPFYMIEPVLIRTHSCRPEYYCVGIDPLPLFSGSVAPRADIARDMYQAQGATFLMQMKATSLRMQGIMMLFSARARVQSSHNGDGLRFFKVERDSRRWLLNSRQARATLNTLADAPWRFPDTPFIHPLNGLVGSTPVELTFCNPGWTLFYEDPTNYPSIEVTVSCSLWSAGKPIPRTELAIRYSRYSRLYSQVAQLAKYSYIEFDEHAYNAASVATDVEALPRNCCVTTVPSTLTTPANLARRTQQGDILTAGAPSAEASTTISDITALVNRTRFTETLTGGGALHGSAIRSDDYGVCADDTGIIFAGHPIRCDCRRTHRLIQLLLTDADARRVEPSQQALAAEAFAQHCGIAVPAQILHHLLTEQRPTPVALVQAIADAHVVWRSVNTYAVLHGRPDGHGGYEGTLHTECEDPVVNLVQTSAGTQSCYVACNGGTLVLGARTQQLAPTWDATTDEQYAVGLRQPVRWFNY